MRLYPHKWINASSPRVWVQSRAISPMWHRLPCCSTARNPAAEAASLSFLASCCFWVTRCVTGAQNRRERVWPRRSGLEMRHRNLRCLGFQDITCLHRGSLARSEYVGLADRGPNWREGIQGKGFGFCWYTKTTKQNLKKSVWLW